MREVMKINAMPAKQGGAGGMEARPAEQPNAEGASELPAGVAGISGDGPDVGLEQPGANGAGDGAGSGDMQGVI